MAVHSKFVTYRNEFSIRQKIGRVFWSVAYALLFRPTPRVGFNGWRRCLLRLFGAKIGKGTILHPSMRVWVPWNLSIEPWSAVGEDVEIYNVAPVRIGLHVVVSKGAYLCTASHNVHTPQMELVTSPISLEVDSWVCARAIILPGVTIGNGSVVGAGAVAAKSVDSWKIVAGNPARVIGERTLKA